MHTYTLKKKHFAFNISVSLAVMANNPAKRARLSQALASLPQRALQRFQRLLKEEESNDPLPTVTRRVAREILQPAWDCFDELTLPADQGGIQFYAANIERLFQYSVQESTAFRSVWPQDNSQPLQLCLYLDEATGGNVLQTSSNKKAVLTYVGIVQMNKLSRSDFWLPYSHIPARDVATAPGGLSAMFAAILRHFHQQRQNRIQVLGKAYTFELRSYVGDYDSIARIYMAKGASGLHPCVLCHNVVARWSHAPDMDAYFVSIGHSKTEDFKMHDPIELNQVHDELLVRFRCATKAAKEEKERQLGFSLHPASLLTCPVARSEMPLTKVIFDAHHCYYANGVAAQELLLFVNRLREKTGVGLADLATSSSEVDWHCSDQHLTPAQRRYLFHESFWSGTYFKGSASQTYCLLSLVHYYGYALGRATMADELRCLTALMEVTRSH